MIGDWFTVSEQPMCVLLADDDEIFRKLAVANLTQDGYRVLCTGTGNEALTQFLNEPVDLVLLDALMPQGDGFATCKKLRQLQGGAHIPILLLTGLEDPETVDRAFDAGATEYVTKPVQWSVLRHRMRRMIREHRADRVARDTQTLLHALIESAPDPILTLEEDGRIRSLNAAAEQLIGGNGSTLAGTNVKALLGKDVVEMKAPSGALEGTLRRMDGVSVPVEVTVNDFSAGDHHYYTAIVRDLTQRKQQEAFLRHAERLESLGQLAGGVAHEFNNKLTVIFGNIDLARQADEAGESVSHFLDNAEAAAISARALASQLLSFARGGPLVKRVVALDQLLREAADVALRGTLCRCILKNATEPPQVAVDRLQIKAAFEALIRNAAEAMPAGGDVEIRIRSHHPDGASDAEFVAVEIADSGVGIPEEILPRIFNPFFTTKPKSRGMGLSLAYSTVQRHNGHLQVASQPGVGTRVTVLLPSEIPEDMVKEERHEPEPKPRGGRILVMEDEMAICELIADALPAYGYAVEIVSTGEEALTAFRRSLEPDGTRFDLVIMDLNMAEGIGAVEVMKRMLEMDPFINAVISSGSPTDPVMVHYKEHGFRFVLPKPYNLIELTNTIASALQSEKAEPGTERFA